MKNFTMIFAVAALAGACATAERIAGPDHADYAISCPAAHLHICFAKAKEVCPKGYDVVRMNRLNSGEVPVVVREQMLLKDHVVVRCET